MFSEADQALTITETLGYPRSIVDHVRIASGEGVIGSNVRERPRRHRPERLRVAPAPLSDRLVYRPSASSLGRVRSPS